MSTHYIGFDKASAWLRELHCHLNWRSLTVNAAIITESQSDRFSTTYNRQYLFLSFVGNDTSTVFYLKSKIGAFQLIGNDETVVEKFEKRAESARSAMKTWLTNESVDWREAVLAVPRDLQMLEGDADFMVYHKDTDQWRLAGHAVDVSDSASKCGKNGK